MNQKEDPVRMADTSKKPISYRVAKAVGEIVLQPQTITAVRQKETKKGDVLTLSEMAGISAAKKTSDLIPLCHQIPLSSIQLSFEFMEDRIRVFCEVKASYTTGVEMEALVGATTALLNIWDMVKYMEKDSEGQYPHAKLENVRVLEKRKVEV